MFEKIALAGVNNAEWLRLGNLVSAVPMQGRSAA